MHCGGNNTFHNELQYIHGDYGTPKYHFKKMSHRVCNKAASVAGDEEVHDVI